MVWGILPVKLDIVPEFDALLGEKAVVNRYQGDNASRWVDCVVRALTSESLNTVRAPCPIAEMRQFVVRNLRGCGLRRRCLPSLWNDFLVTVVVWSSCRLCRRLETSSTIDFHRGIATRQPTDHLTALRGSFSRK